MVRMPNRSETPTRVQRGERDLREFVASVARSFQKSADNVYDRVIAAVQLLFWTRDQSDDRFAFKSHNHNASDITSGTVARPVNTTSVDADRISGGTVSGSTGTFSGAVSGASGAFSGPVSGTQGTFPTGVRSTGARARQLTTDYVSAYLDGDGNLGYAPSTLASKDVGTAYQVDMQKFLAVVLYNWQYKGGGMHGIGPLADDLDAAGLTEFVTYDAVTGKPQGVREQTLIIGLWSAYVQARTATLAELAKRMVQAVTLSNMTALGINAEKTYAIVWPKEFADTSYAVTASVTSSGLALAAVCAIVPGSKTKTGCSVTVRSLGLSIAANSTLTVEAIHV